MILWGEIKEFPLFAVLQFLAGQRSTGVLEIQDFEELGDIYLRRGCIEAVSSVGWDEVLGAKLVVAGALTEFQVKECLMESGSGDTDRPVAARLVQRAQGDPRGLREIVDDHIGDVVMELMCWNVGTFRLSAFSKPVEFAVVPLRKTEEMLIDAFRRVDEGERPRHEKTVMEEEICLTCTVECTEEIKARYLKADLCLWRSMPSILKDPIYQEIKRRRSDDYEGEAFDELSFI